MRIAQVAPLYESVPPQRYGGTERVVSYLTEELVRQGHQVTLYASGDSQTSARLVPITPKALRLGERYTDATVYDAMTLERVFADSHEHDVVHYHTGHIHFPMSRWIGVPNVTTMHGRQDLAELGPLFKRFPDAPVVSISDDQRTPVPHANWVSTVYHGLPSDLLQFNPEPSDYFAFIGRISPEKRVDRAIEIASAVDIPLRIAAKVDDADKDYYEDHIRPMLDHPLVDFVGEVDDAGKQELLGNARALLFPIDWPEPFGLVMIEAMACGTPTIAWRRGSVPEVMTDPASGVVVETIGEAVEAAKHIDRLDRAECRAAFDKRFTDTRMAEDYVRVYQHLMLTDRQSSDATTALAHA